MTASCLFEKRRKKKKMGIERKGRDSRKEKRTHPQETTLSFNPRKKSQISNLSLSSEDPLVGAIAQQLLTDREGHDKTAAEWTRRYAQG